MNHTVTIKASQKQVSASGGLMKLGLFLCSSHHLVSETGFSIGRSDGGVIVVKETKLESQKQVSASGGLIRCWRCC